MLLTGNKHQIKQLYKVELIISLHFLVKSWATPAQRLQVTRLKPKSPIVDAEYKLAVYERNIQVG